MLKTFEFYLTSRLLWEFLAVGALIALLSDIRLR